MGFIDKYLFGKDDESTQKVEQPKKEQTGVTVVIPDYIPKQNEVNAPKLLTTELPEKIQDSLVNYNEMITKEFEKVLESGLDFYKFMRALAKTNPNLPEEERYKTAFVAWDISDISPDSLIQTSDKYQKVLQDLARGMANSVIESNKRVNASEGESKALETENEVLRKKIEDNSARIAELNTYVSESRVSIETEAKSFNIAHTSMQKRVNEIKEKINQYLKTNEPATIK